MAHCMGKSWIFSETSAVLSYEPVSSFYGSVVLSDISEVLSYVPLSSFLSFRGIIIWAGILSFKVPWYYRTLPRYYHMCRYLLSYHSAVFSHVPVSSLLGFRSDITFSSGWSQFSLLWSLGFLDSPAVTVCLWTSEIRRTRPFQLSSVSQQLAT